ncbi:MAG TPA: cytochrome c-type biogenesis CcmF C-terminal domain-containing protein, partial [Vicinamibacterales bacterium]|nr:cytochrome c-type biogenesis CcmF C-terminal domain-containing protein [Vicinamibacterales bacterium]
FSAFFVLFATMFPTLSEALRGERLTVGPPFFNKWMLPIGLVLLLLTGIGPLLAWRKSSAANLVRQFLWPAVSGLATGIALFALGVRVWSSGICFAICAFVFVTIAQEFIRGAQVRRGATGTDILTALIGLVGRSKRRYGGYIVHVGIVLMFLGFAGEGFKQEEQVLLKPGQEVAVAHFTVRHDALRVTNDGQKQMITGHVSVSDDGEAIGAMRPAKWFFNRRENEPTTEVAIRRTIAEDLYIVLAGYDVAAQSATYAITVNPLVNWIWFGFGVMALGSIIALLPEGAYAFAAARAPAGAATTSLLLILCLLPAGARAQTAQSVVPAAKSELRKQLEGDIMCMCGCRAPMNDCPMGPTCHGLQEQNALMDKFLAAGMTREEVRAAFVAHYGSQDVLAAPIDEGFNRLAWLLPYLLGTTGALAAAFVAFRWARREPEPQQQAPAPTDDPNLLARLDDELRDLD